jgi:hypothetical protein
LLKSSSISSRRLSSPSSSSSSDGPLRRQQYKNLPLGPHQRPSLGGNKIKPVPLTRTTKPLHRTQNLPLAPKMFLRPSNIVRLHGRKKQVHTVQI